MLVASLSGGNPTVFSRSVPVFLSSDGYHLSSPLTMWVSVGFKVCLTFIRALLENVSGCIALPVSAVRIFAKSFLVTQVFPTWLTPRSYQLVTMEFVPFITITKNSSHRICYNLLFSCTLYMPDIGKTYKSSENRKTENLEETMGHIFCDTWTPRIELS